MTIKRRKIIKALLICGIIAVLLYIGVDALAASLYPGYSYTNQAISELSAIEAPTSRLWTIMVLAFNPLIIALGIGVWLWAEQKRSLRVTGLLLAAWGLLGFVWLFFPMNMRGNIGSATDTGHLVLSGITVLLIAVFMACGSNTQGKWFRWYSLATILIMLTFGILVSFQAPRVAAQLPTPGMGILERISVFSPLLWVLVLIMIILSKLKSIPKQVIIYSHGFGVRRDDMGLLTDIAASLPEAKSILFDYFAVDKKEKTMTICPLSAQVQKLNQVIEKAKMDYPGAIIDLIGHSQGTVVAALANPIGIRRAILLAPVFDMNIERTLARYRQKPGAEINMDGTSKLPSGSSGLTKIVPAKYWQERAKDEPIKEYNTLAQRTEVLAIIAKQDQLLPPVDLKELDPRIKVISLDGDHNFNGAAREPLLKAIKKLLII
ncbi:MAG TPA: YqiA/YcfP family alpha/beta fold hydrolase [bacterium]|nr:YqiA/YcfP family alpha/beta fold hydrolase [bacterium]